jgi:hypothetical protein
MTNTKLNDKQQKFLEILAQNPDGLTLAEASDGLGFELKPGTTNTLITKGLVQVVGEKKIPVTTYRAVQVYALAKADGTAVVEEKQ